MTEKKLTDEKIIKHLEQCLKRGNRNYGTGFVLHVINCQKKEIERLKNKVEELSEVLSDTIRITYAEAKSEAVEEFVNAVCEEIKKAYNNNSGVLREHFEKHGENPDFELVATITGKMNTLRGLYDFIARQEFKINPREEVKEMSIGVKQNDNKNK